MKYCKDLQIALTDEDECNVDAVEFKEELTNLSPLLSEQMISLEVLNYIYKNNLTRILPNVCASLRIILTLPVTVARGERSFSKLELIKIYLRSTMSQERLSDLAILSIER